MIVVISFKMIKQNTVINNEKPRKQQSIKIKALIYKY